MALLLAALALGEEGKSPEPPAPPNVPEPVRHELRLRGGSTLVGTLEPAEFKVKTAFGELSVPVAELKRVVFGRGSDPERLARVASAIAELGSASPEKRLNAQAHLAQEGRFAAPDLAEAAGKHADPEVRRACKEIYDAMQIPEDEELAPADDLVETTRFALRGSVQQGAFKITLAELGPIDVRRQQVAQIRRFVPRREERVTMDGQFTTMGAWFDSKFAFEKGEEVRLSASGSITFPNWGGQMFDPDGNMQMGQINGHPMGCLMGRFGDAGQMFRVGRAWSGLADGRGTLRLAAMLTMRGQPSTGEFTIKVERE